MENWKVQVGNFLFKWRSFTQLPWIVLVIIFLKPFYPRTIIEIEPFLTISGILITLFGEILRIWTHLYAMEGTSGRESFMRADSLNTDGPYKIIRNPLYSGNFLIVGGLLIVFSNVIAFVIGISFLIFQYSFIVIAEENYLAGKFGEKWIEYKKQIPQFIPKIKNFKKETVERRNSIKKVLLKEMDTIFNVFTALFVIFLIKLHNISPLSKKAILQSLILYALFLIFYLILKTNFLKPSGKR
ncbi:MAG: methyltransferase family protein [Candidatus Aminicenantia bacterium]